MNKKNLFVGVMFAISSILVQAGESKSSQERYNQRLSPYRLSRLEDKSFHENDRYYYNEVGSIQFTRPSDKAIFFAIEVGMNHDYVNLLIEASKRNSSSPKFNTLLDLEVKAAYRKSPILAQIEFDARSADKASTRIELEAKAKEFKKRFAGGEHY